MNSTFSIKRSLPAAAVVILAALSLTGCNHGATADGGGKDSAKAADEGKVEQAASVTPTVPVVVVQQKQLHTTLSLPGQLLAYQDVPIHAKVQGYISWIGVDRGSVVKKNQLLAVITAPEQDARVKEAQAKLSMAESSLSEAESSYQSMLSKKQQTKAKLDADKLTYQRLQQAAKTPGAVAQNEVDLAEKAVESDEALIRSIDAEVLARQNVVKAHHENVDAAKNVVASEQALQSYLQVRAPFDGVITERNVHNGSIVAVDKGRGDDVPMLRIQQKSTLRLVVAVPEASVAGVKTGGQVSFTVPAYLGKTFEGTIARVGYALDQKTRTMPVEMDVNNANGELEPGMFATVAWDVTRPYPTLFVPSTAAASDLKDTFVIRIRDGISERVPVTRGQQMGNLVEIVGDIHAGDQVALKATDEIKPGTHLIAQLASEKDIAKAGNESSAGGE